MNKVRAIKLAACGLLTISAALATATTAEAATAQQSAPASVSRPMDWYDTGVAYRDYATCADWGGKAVESGNFYGWACVQNSDGSYELWLDD